MPANNALHNAAETGNIAELESQVSNYDINAKGGYDRTALYYAVQNGHLDAAKLLLTHNADVSIPDVSIHSKTIFVKLLSIFLISHIFLCPTFCTYCYFDFEVLDKPSSTTHTSILRLVVHSSNRHFFALTHVPF